MTGDEETNYLAPQYIDIGKYFNGTNRILVYSNMFVSWFSRLAQNSNEAFNKYTQRIGYQFKLNGLEYIEIFCVSEHINAPSLNMFVDGLSRHLNVTFVEMEASKLNDYLEKKSTVCPLCISVQGLEKMEFILNVLKRGVSLALVSDKILFPGERLHSFVYLTTPNIKVKLEQSAIPDLYEPLKNLSLDSNRKNEEETVTKYKKFSYGAIKSSMIGMVQSVTAFPVGFDTAASDINLPLYGQVDEDLLPIMDSYEEEDAKGPSSNTLKIEDEESRQRRSSSIKKAQRKTQIFYSRVHFHANSLSGASKLYRPIVLSSSASPTLEDHTKDSGDASIRKDKAVNKSKGAKEKKTKAQIIKEENERRLLESELSKQKSILAAAIENMSGLRNTHEKLAILESLKISSGSSIRAMDVAFLLAKMDVYVGAWKEDILNRPNIASSTTDADFVNAVAVLEHLFDVYDDYLDVLSMEQLEGNILPALLMFGFIEASELFVQQYCKVNNVGALPLKKLQATLKNLSGSIGKYKVKLSYSRFQLLFCGHLFPRSLDAVSDDRVLFKPDGWQVELLNVVDRNESALICAPTSSGKTFICFYAMERILKSNHDDVVVYIAPNKALMNQVIADVYARFQQKVYPSHSNRKLFGKLDNKEVICPFECQVLVTFPDVFESFVLSPLYAAYLKKRVKYIILDEIHTIGEESKGAAWEKIIITCQCPILALSATVGNKKAFTQWLDRISSRIGIRCNLIESFERFSDLKRYVYSSSSTTDIDCSKLESIRATGKQRKETSTIVQLHPLLSVPLDELGNMTLPEDFHFLPGDTLRLVDALRATLSSSEDSIQRQMEALTVEVYFKGKFRISKKEARVYESLVKSFLRTNIETGYLGLIQMKTLMDHLSGRALGVLSVVHDQLAKIGTQPSLGKSCMALMMDLISEEKLPAIIFNFDRQFCTTLAVRLIEDLELAESYKRARHSKEERKVIAEIEKQQRALKRQRDVVVKKKDAWIEESVQEETMADLSAGIGTLDPELTFQDPRYKLRDSDLDELLRDFRVASKMTSPSHKTLLKGLRRGIAVHHGGVPKQYLLVVEHLFRRRHLQVVFATSTLALGINMPAKSVVFAGDDLSLTPLEFRQMEGRAGRRGFDDLGHVIFWNVPKSKIDRLISSSLPSIIGDLPLTATVALQLFHMATIGETIHLANGLKVTMKSPSNAVCSQELSVDERGSLIHSVLDRLLNDPLFSISDPSITRLTRPHLRILSDYLVRFGFINGQGLPTLYARLPLLLPGQLHSVFLLSFLMKNGTLDRLCEGFDEANEKTLRRLMNLFAHLFFHHYIPDSDTLMMTELEPLDVDVQETLKAYNKELLLLLAAYSKELGIYQSPDGKDMVMDLANRIEFKQGALIANVSKFECLIQSEHESSSTPPLIMASLGLPFYAIPRHARINPYIMSYWNHSDKTRLGLECQLQEKDFYVDFENLDNTLKQIVAAVEDNAAVAAGLVQRPTVLALSALALEWRKKFRKMWA